MIQTSAEYQQKIAKDGRKQHVKATVTLGNGAVYLFTDADIMEGSSISLSDGTSESGSFTVGTFISRCLTIKLSNFDEKMTDKLFDNSTIELSEGLVLTDATESTPEVVEWVSLGVFGTGEHSESNGVITLTAYDDSTKFDKKYDSSLHYPASLSQILSDACSKCGVTLATTDFPNADYIVAAKPSDDSLTYADIVSYVAQLAGRWARISTGRQLVLGFYDMDEFYPDSGDIVDGGNFSDYSQVDTVDGGTFADAGNPDSDVLMGGVFRQGLPTPVTISSLSSCTLQTEDVRITGVKLVPTDNKQATLLKGTDDYVITIDKNQLIPKNRAWALNNLAKQLVDFQFRPMEIAAWDNPSIEAGDVAYLIDPKGNRHKTIISNLAYEFGNYEQFSADAKSKSDIQSERYSTSEKAASALQMRKDSGYITTGQISESDAAALAAELQQELISPDFTANEKSQKILQIQALTSPMGKQATAEGLGTTASGWCAHAEGESTTASDGGAHAEGDVTIASGHDAHAEGYSTAATGNNAHAEGAYTNASESCSHAEGGQTTASGEDSHAEGCLTTASGYTSHAEGESTAASGHDAHAEGLYTNASESCSHAEGGQTTASGEDSHAEGFGTVASGEGSHVEGGGTTAHDYCEHAGGNDNKVSTGNQTAFAATNNAFVLGNGTNSSNPSNCFRVDFSGNVYGCAAFNASGADYAEYFEWLDKNPEKQDRVGRFVALNGTKIELAKPNDDVLGIVSGCPSVIGDAASESWNGRYARDIFGRPILESVNVPEAQKKGKNGKVIRTIPAHAELRFKENPDYKPEEEMDYIPREKRPEWAAIGMMGKLVMIDDGTCKSGGYCQPAANGTGIATATEERNNCRVMERLDGTHIRVCLK